MSDLDCADLSVGYGGTVAVRPLDLHVAGGHAARRHRPLGRRQVVAAVGARPGAAPGGGDGDRNGAGRRSGAG